MSLILEALRKSEAERRRGNAPDVAMELPPAATPRTRAMPEWLLPAMACLVVIALLAAWWWSQGDTKPASDAPAAATATEAPRIETPAQPVVIARPAAPSPAPVSAAPAPRGVTPPIHGESEPPVIAPAPVPMPANDPPALDAASMPQAKLSMHMWDESPARRFVILNGQRMGEGDRNGDITVVGIERDGVIVERNGQRAKIVLP